MRTGVKTALLLSVLALAAGAGGASAGAPQVRIKVVGERFVLQPAHGITARAATVTVAGRRCAVAAGTPLAALLALRRIGGPSIKLRDYGSCSRRAVDGASLFVYQVGSERNRGQDGWVYQVNGRLGTAGAADPSGPFGSGLLRGGQRLLWFWCRSSGGVCRARRGF